MKKIIRWVYRFVRTNYKYPKYLVFCLADREPLENEGYWSAIRVLDFDTKKKAINWISFNVAEADREDYVIYKLDSKQSDDVEQDESFDIQTEDEHYWKVRESLREKKIDNTGGSKERIEQELDKAREEGQFTKEEMRILETSMMWVDYEILEEECKEIKNLENRLKETIHKVHKLLSKLKDNK